MQNRSSVLMITALVLIITAGFSSLAAGETDISGTLDTRLIWEEEADNIYDEEMFNLVVQRRFGLDAEVVVDLAVYSYRTDKTVAVDEEGNKEIITLPQMTRETETALSEAYINYYTTNMDWQLGKQVINWGSSYNLQPTDYINPFDLRTLNPLDNKVGIKAVKGTYFAPENIEITGILNPFFASHKTKDTQQLKQINDFKDRVATNMLDQVHTIEGHINTLNSELTDLGYPTVSNIEADKQRINTHWISQDIESVEDKPENVQGGAQITQRRLGNFDVALSAYHGRDKIPAVNQAAVSENLGAELYVYEQNLTEIENKLQAGQDPQKEISELNYLISQIDEQINIKPLLVYPQANRIGLDIIGDLVEVGIWGELSFSFYEDDQFEDRLEIAAGIDRRFENDLYLMGQLYHQQARQENENDINLATIYFDSPVGDFHEVEMAAMYELESETLMVEPQFNYSLADSTVWETGLTYTDQDNEAGGLIDTLIDTRVHTGIRVDF